MSPQQRPKIFQLLRTAKFCNSPLGVAGICFDEDKAILKGGKEGVLTEPANVRTILSGTRKSQYEVEWRCLSFREVRVVATEEGNDEENAIGSSGTKKYAEQDCAASLEKEMMTLFAPLRWHTELRVVVVVDDEGLTWRAIEEEIW